MQATFAEYAENTPDFPGISRDEWGPTMRRPVPIEEAERSAIEGWLADKGFNLDCIREAEGTCTLGPDDSHPDDRQASWEVPGSLFGNDDRRRELEALVREDLTGLSEYDDPASWCDKRSPIHRNDGARGTTRAVAEGGQP